MTACRPDCGAIAAEAHGKICMFTNIGPRLNQKIAAMPEKDVASVTAVAGR